MSVDTKAVINADTTELLKYLVKKYKKVNILTYGLLSFHVGVKIGKEKIFIFVWNRGLRKGTTGISVCHNDTPENLAYSNILDICENFGGKIKKYDNLTYYKKISCCSFK